MARPAIAGRATAHIVLKLVYFRSSSMKGPSMTSDQVVIADDGPFLRATVRLPRCTADQAMEAFTVPERLRQWWGGELSTDLTAGGPYTIFFRGLGQTMAGRVVRYVPGRTLEVTWAWDHERQPARRTVVIAADGSGPAIVTIEHGPHGVTEPEARARAEHRAGWEFFLPKLVALLAGPDAP